MKRAARMEGRVYRLPERVWWGQGRGGSDHVRVLVQGRGWPTNVLVEVVASVRGPTVGHHWWPTGERFVRPARGLRIPR